MVCVRLCNINSNVRRHKYTFVKLTFSSTEVVAVLSQKMNVLLSYMINSNYKRLTFAINCVSCKNNLGRISPTPRFEQRSKLQIITHKF